MSRSIELWKKHGTVSCHIPVSPNLDGPKFVNEVLSSFDQASHGGGQTRVSVRETMTAMTADVQQVQLEVSYKPLPHPRCRRVVLVDTPGFDHTTMSDADVFSKIAIWLRSQCPPLVL